MPRPAKHFVEKLFAEQYPALLAFFQRRLRSRTDVPDLAHEVYLRMLRVSDVDAIRSPEKYLFTVASNLVKERAVLDGRQASAVDLDAAATELQLQELPCFEANLDSARRLELLRVVFAQLPPKCRATVVMQYRDGLSYQQIGARLGISTNMVKKYLAQALTHCRRRMARLA